MITQDITTRIRSEAAKVLVGQEEAFTQLLIALFSGGHVLLEGVPGTAKTLMAKTLAALTQTEFKRVQFTPDLMPSDVVGTQVYEMGSGQFRLRTGPIFTNVLLGDEINRAPAKTQSALLEAMEERQVTIEGQRLPLPEPFFVLATQNPVEYEGTYPLPEAQLDRFAMKLVVRYPSREEELRVLDRMARTENVPKVRAVTSLDQIREARAAIDQVALDPRLREYIVSVVHATRAPKEAGLGELVGRIHYGASPRATIWLALCARANAFLEGRPYVVPGDIKRVAPDALRHRVLPTYEADAEGLSSDKLVARVLETVPVP
jgi:MoxR-like ATPase